MLASHRRRERELFNFYFIYAFGIKNLPVAPVYPHVIPFGIKCWWSSHHRPSPPVLGFWGMSSQRRPFNQVEKCGIKPSCHCRQLFCVAMAAKIIFFSFSSGLIFWYARNAINLFTLFGYSSQAFSKSSVYWLVSFRLETSPLLTGNCACRGLSPLKVWCCSNFAT